VDPERAAILVEEYLAGATMREVAAHHGVSAKLVQRAMRQLGAATRTAEERAGYPARVERWAAAYAQGVTTAKIASMAGVSEQTVRQRLRQHGVRLPRPARPQARKRDDQTIRELMDRYAAGETLAELGQELGVSGARVQQLMKDGGVPLEELTRLHESARSQLRDRADRVTLNESMARNPTLSIRELADVLGMAPGRVKRLLGPEAPARRRPPRPPRAQSPSEPLSAAIRACAKASGRARGEPLSGTSYEAWASERDGMPSRAVLVRRFGSWAKAVKAAGYRPAVTPRRLYRRLSHTDAVATVGAFVLHERAQGRPPSSRYYPAWAREHDAPSLAGLGLYWRWSDLVTEALASLAEPGRRS
jgi:transposase